MSRVVLKSLLSLSTLLLLTLACLFTYSISSFYSKVGSDFVQDYSAGYAILHDQSIYLDIPQIAELIIPNSNYNNFHPPTASIILLPFALFSFHDAFNLLNCISVILLFVTIYLSCKEHSNFKKWCYFLFPLAVFWPPFVFCIGTGQVSMIIAFLIILTGILYQKSIKILAGITLAMAALLKLFPLYLLLFFLFKKDLRVVASTIITFLLGWLIAFIVVGDADCLFYLTNVIGRNVGDWSFFPVNQSLSGVFSTLFVNNRWSQHYFDLPVLATISVILFTILLSLWYIVNLQKFNNCKRNPLFGYWLGILPMLLISPITWGHIFPVLIYSLILTANINLKKERSQTTLLVAILLITIPQLEIARMLYFLSSPGKLLLLFLPLTKLGFFGLLLLWREMLQAASYSEVS